MKILFLPVAMVIGFAVSCRDDMAVEEGSPENSGQEPVPRDPPVKEPELGSPESVPATGHIELIETFIDFKKDFLEALVSVTDAESAKKFEAGLKKKRARLKELLAAAEALPAPENEAKRHFKTLQEDFSDKSASLMDAFLERVRSGPDRDEIQRVLEALSGDAEAEELNRKLVELYW